jgi:cytochrome P450
MKRIVNEPPGPAGFLPLRTLFALYRNPLNALQSLARDYGDMVVFRIGFQPVYLMNHPDLVEEVLLKYGRISSKRVGNRLLRRNWGDGLITSHGEEHLHQRRMLQPLFHHHHLASYVENIVDCARQTRERWQDGETLDMFEEMNSLSLAVVGKTLFSTEFDSEAEDILKALAVLLEQNHVAILVFSEMFDKLPLLNPVRSRQAVKRLNAVINRLIREGRIQDRQGDLLSLLRSVEDDKGNLNDTQVRDQAMSIFLASFETIAVGLTWTYYLLSQHPTAETRFLEEIDQVLGERLPTVDDLPNLKYTHQVLKEALRLYPPVWAHERRLTEACQLGKWELPAGSIVIINHWLLHHDPRFFADPECFDPKRWESDSAATLPRLAYSPFSAGQRKCIGEGFAWMEGVLLLATLAQRWQIRLAPGHQVEINPVLTLRPKYGMRMTLNRRIELTSG